MKKKQPFFRKYWVEIKSFFFKFKKRSRFLAYLSMIGPGLLALSAGNDAGGIATYAQAGAAYKYQLLWLLFLLTFALIVVQEMAARMAVVTGKGLADLIREHFGVRWTVIAMFAMTTANFFVVTANIAGIAAALLLFNISPAISVPATVFGIWWLLTRGSYKMAEKGLIVLTSLFLAYPIAAFTVNPNWSEVFHEMLVPSREWLGNFDIGFLQLAIGLIGTTIAPWMTFYLQASVTDKGVGVKDMDLQRFDVVFGAISADVIAFFIIVTSAVLYSGFGQQQFVSAGDASMALKSLVGGYAPYLFGAGLFGASVLGTAALPLTTAYAITESFGWEHGLNNRFRTAPIFFSVLTGILVFAAAVVLLTPHKMLFHLILLSQVINGMLIPIIMVFMTKLCNNKRLMGKYTNSRIFNIIAWSTVGLITIMTVSYFYLIIVPVK